MQLVGDGNFASKREETNRHPADPGCTAGAVLGCRCLTEAEGGERSPKGAIPPLFTKAGTPSFLIMPALCPQALA